MLHPVVLALAAVIAVAQGDAGISCAARRLDPVRAASIGTFIAAGEQGATAEAEASYDRDIDALADAALACATQFGWTGDQAGAAAAWAVASFARPRLADSLRRFGLDPARAERAVARLSPADRAALNGDDSTISDKAVEALLRLAAQEGLVVEDDERKAMALGAFAGLVAAGDAAIATFGAP